MENVDFVPKKIFAKKLRTAHFGAVRNIFLGLAPDLAARGSKDRGLTVSV